MFGWIKTAFSSAYDTIRGGRSPGARGGLSLVANWLQNLKWTIESKFLPLAQQAYGQNEVVYSCLKLLSQSVPEAPCVPYRYDEETGDKDRLPRRHPLACLIRHPNRLMTEYEFWELTTLHMAIVGRSCWWKQRNNMGEVIALWPLRPDRIGPRYSAIARYGEEVLAGWNYQVPGTGLVVELGERDVLAFNFPDPTGESGGIVEGYGPLQALARQVASDNEATKFVGALLANYAAPTVVLKVKAPIRNEDEAKIIKAAFRQEFGGANRGVPAVVDAETDVDVIGFNLQELEFPELREIAESRICACLGVPAILVGTRVGLKLGNNRASITEQRSYFAETTLFNYWRRYQDQLSEDLASEFGDDMMCEFDTSKVGAMQRHIAERMRPIRDAWEHGAATRNEYRKALGLAPVADGNVWLLPTSMRESAANDAVAEAIGPPGLQGAEGPAEGAPDAQHPAPGTLEGPVGSAVRALPPFEYGSTQFDLPPEIGQEILALGRMIPDEALAASGREEEPHVTVKYGIRTPFREAAERLRTGLISQGPLKLHFGRTALFETDDYDVLYFAVESEELVALHQKIVDLVDCVETQGEYIPHATVAYLKKGEGAKYLENDRLYGLATWVDALKVCGPSGEHETVGLTHQEMKGLKAAPLDEDEEKLIAILAALLAAWQPKAIAALRDGVPFDYEGFGQDLHRALEGQLVTASLAAIRRAMAETTVGVDPAELGAAVLAWAADYLDGLIQRLLTTTQGVMAGAATALLLDSTLSDEELAALIAAGFADYRAELIGISENTAAIIAGVVIYQQWLERQGFRKVLEYVTAADEKVCEICAPSHGAKEGETLFAYPPRHGRCRCRLRLREIRQ